MGSYSLIQSTLHSSYTLKEAEICVSMRSSTDWSYISIQSLLSSITPSKRNNLYHITFYGPRDRYECNQIPSLVAQPLQGTGKFITCHRNAVILVSSDYPEIENHPCDYRTE